MNETEQAEFDALVAELEAPDQDDTDPPAGDDDTPDQDAADDNEPPLDDDNQDESDEAPLDAGPAAGELLEAGDLKGFCEKVGLTPKRFQELTKINPREFTAMRLGLKDANAAKKVAETKAAAAEKLQADAEQVYGPIVAGFQAHKKGDSARLRAAIELLAEDTFENVVASVAKAGKPDPAAQVEALRRELAEEKAKKTKDETAAATAAAVKAQVTTIEGRLKGTPLEKIPGAAQEIFDTIKGSFDGTGYALNLKQAYAQVKAKHAKVAEAFGVKPAKKEVVVEQRRPLQRVRGVDPATPADPKLSRAQQEEAEFQAVLREAKEATRRGERVSRRGAR